MCHDSKMVQIDTLTNTNLIDLLSSLLDGQKAIVLAYLSEQSP